MNFIDNKLAIAFWGTKRGKGVFYHNYLDISNKELALKNKIELSFEMIDSILIDIRSVVSIHYTDISFYLVEYKKDYKQYTIFRTIKDWLGRLGYYAISIFVPNDKLINENLFSILDTVSKNYWQRYIVQEKGESYQRIRNVAENFSLLVEPLEKLQLMPATQPYFSAADNSGIIYFKPEEKENVLAHASNDLFKSYKSTFIFPETFQNPSLTTSLVNINIQDELNKLIKPVTKTETPQTGAQKFPPVPPVYVEPLRSNIAVTQSPMEEISAEAKLEKELAARLKKADDEKAEKEAKELLELEKAKETAKKKADTNKLIKKIAFIALAVVAVVALGYIAFNSISEPKGKNKNEVSSIDTIQIRELVVNFASIDDVDDLVRKYDKAKKLAKESKTIISKEINPGFFDKLNVLSNNYLENDTDFDSTECNNYLYAYSLLTQDAEITIRISKLKKYNLVCELVELVKEATKDKNQYDDNHPEGPFRFRLKHLLNSIIGNIAFDGGIGEKYYEAGKVLNEKQKKEMKDIVLYKYLKSGNSQ